MDQIITKANQRLDADNKDIDRTAKKVETSYKLLENYLNSASNCCLYVYIAVAFLIFLVLVSL